MLFLTDVDHVSFEKANETRQNNLQSATVSLQVVIGLCKRKETAALKIKAAVSNGRVKLSALRRLFFFCRRAADNILGDNQLSFSLLRCCIVFLYDCGKLVILNFNPFQHTTKGHYRQANKSVLFQFPRCSKGNVLFVSVLVITTQRVGVVHASPEVNYTSGRFRLLDFGVVDL